MAESGKSLGNQDKSRRKVMNGNLFSEVYISLVLFVSPHFNRQSYAIPRKVGGKGKRETCNISIMYIIMSVSFKSGAPSLLVFFVFFLFFFFLSLKPISFRLTTSHALINERKETCLTIIGFLSLSITWLGSCCLATWLKLRVPACVRTISPLRSRLLLLLFRYSFSIFYFLSFSFHLPIFHSVVGGKGGGREKHSSTYTESAAPYSWVIYCTCNLCDDRKEALAMPIAIPPRHRISFPLVLWWHMTHWFPIKREKILYF